MKRILFFLILGVSVSVFSQKKKEEQEVNIIKHTVALGETVKMISKKYRVVPLEIYKLNEDAVNGVTSGMVLYIPVPVKVVPTPTIENDLEGSTKESSTTAVAEKKEVKNISNPENVSDIENQVEFVYHIVLSGETLYGLAKKYNTSVEEIKTLNEDLSGKGLQVGQTLKIKKQLVF